MAVSAELGRPRPVGRVDEVAGVVGLAREAAGGHSGALLVSGEAGVGKTALVREACSQVGDVAEVLWAPCLPLTSLAVPFLPLTSALREWAAGRGVPVPVMRLSSDRAAGDGPVEFDAWLDDLCRTRPVVLAVDDLHWADQSTLDVLMYVIAGLAGRRLAVVTTVRTGEVGEGHPLRRWLADVRRLPGVGELRLGRLDRVATAAQMAGLLGRPPHQSLVDAVFARTHGNAYMTTLLVQRLQPDARSLPAGLPTELRDAAANAWHGLSAPARELTRLIAVAGHPQRADQLGEVARATGITGDLVRLLREAVDGAVLEVGADGGYWFVHPLLAEVLVEGLLPEERRSLHAAFAAVLASGDVPVERLGVEQAVDLADHHHRAGHPVEALEWALRGAEAAGHAGGATEMLRLLRRALELRDVVPDAASPGSTCCNGFARRRSGLARTKRSWPRSRICVRLSTATRSRCWPPNCSCAGGNSGSPPVGSLPAWPTYGRRCGSRLRTRRVPSTRGLWESWRTPSCGTAWSGARDGRGGGSARAAVRLAQGTVATR